jgi:hypothetical protein
MADFEVDIDLDGRTRPIGLARSNRVRGTVKLTRFGGAPQAFAGGFIDAPHSSALLA